MGSTFLWVLRLYGHLLNSYGSVRGTRAVQGSVHIIWALATCCCLQTRDRRGATLIDLSLRLSLIGRGYNKMTAGKDTTSVWFMPQRLLTLTSNVYVVTTEVSTDGEDKADVCFPFRSTQTAQSSSTRRARTMHNTSLASQVHLRCGHG